MLSRSDYQEIWSKFCHDKSNFTCLFILCTNAIEMHFYTLCFFLAKDSSLKVIRFLFFHTVQNMHNGIDFQVFLLFFWTKEPLQLIRASLTVWGKTHLSPTRAKRISHYNIWFSWGPSFVLWSLLLIRISFHPLKYFPSILALLLGPLGNFIWYCGKNYRTEKHQSSLLSNIWMYGRMNRVEINFELSNFMDYYFLLRG